MQETLKNVYFISDAHLGSRAIPHGRMMERRLVNFLDGIKEKASAVYMLGDMFDFWHEYRMVVPKGYTRFLGKISELTDRGIEVHFFTGNHDLWCGRYLEKECGVVLHRESCTVEIEGKLFYLGHGDGLDLSDRYYLLLRSIFHNRICQKLFASIHPRWGMDFGLAWAAHSRKKHEQVEGFFEGPERDGLVAFSRTYLKTHPEISYFIFGHRHVDVDLTIDDTARFVILGDWITKCTFGVFDGEHLFLENFVEGETRL